MAWFENSPSKHFILADFPAWNFSGSGCAILGIKVETDIALHIMKKSRSWHWNMDWLQDAKFSGENSCWCFMSVVCCLLWLWTVTELSGKCRCPRWNLLALQSRAEGPIYYRLHLHSLGNCSSALLGLGCVWTPPRERGCFPPALNNTSVWPGPGRGRRQHRARVIGWDTDWRGTKGQNNYECIPKLFEFWLYTQTCVWLFPL